MYAEDVAPSVVPNTDQSSSAELSIKVRDVDDNPPFFVLRDKAGTIPEGRPAGSPVMRMPAEDPDEDSKITYRLVEPSDEFEIDENTAEIRTKKELDRESEDGFEFKLEVEASDENGDTCVGIATIVVSDVNDNEPKCERSDYVISVSEGATSGQSVFMFNIEDKDSNSVNGENSVEIIEGNVAAVFDITNPVGKSSNLLISSLDVGLESKDSF